MLSRSLKNSLRDGFKGIGRNFFLSLASMATITVSLIVLGLMYIIIANVRYMSTQLDDSLSVVVFMQEDVTDEQIQHFIETLSKRKEVERVEFTSAEEALEEFRTQLGEDGTFDPSILDYFDENPLAHSANIEIFLKDTTSQESLINYLQVQEHIVRKVNYSSDFANVLSTFSNMVTIVGMVIILFLILVTVVLIMNTIKASIQSRKEEIEIMKYLGAADVYVEGPFIVQGLVIGILGTVIPCLTIWFGYDYLVSVLVNMFSGVMSLFQFLPLWDIVKILFPIFGLLGIFLSVLGTILSMSKNLRV